MKLINCKTGGFWSAVLSVGLWGLTGGGGRAAEVAYAFTYNGTNYTTKVWWDDALAVGQIQGVIVHFNYGAGANLYTNPNWRSFATTRKLAMLLHITQDSFLSAADGLTLLQNTLNYAATQSGHTELAAAGLPYLFTGVSRGGTLGAINLGWTAGLNKTIACVAYHGASFQYVPAVGAAAKVIPVLYPIAEQDDPTQGRQAIIESTVRTDPTSYRRYDGLFWTTTMQYGYAHNTTGDDTYPLQWLGRVIDIRYDPTTPGILKTNLLMSGTGINYTMTDANTVTCRFTNVASAPSFILKNQMIWIPPGNTGEWYWENTTPHINSATITPSATSPGQTNTVTVVATDPNREPLSYTWSLQSGPAGGTVTFGNASATNTTAVLGPTPGTYVLRVQVSDPGTNNTGTVTAVVTGTTPALLGVSPSSYDFGSVPVATTVPTSFIVTNRGDFVLTGTATTASPFAIVDGGSFTVAAKSSTNVVVSFTPIAPGPISNAVIFTSNGGSSTNAVTGSGIPVPTRIIGVSGNLAFGNVQVGLTATAPLTITNTGNSPLTVSGISYPDGFSGVFSGSIAAGGSTNVTVTFAPVAVTNYSGTLTVTSDATSGTGTLSASGAGTDAAPVAAFSATPTNGVASLVVTFTDISTGAITNRNWSFGDGATTNVTATTLPHTYLVAGTNTVRLIVSGPGGASTNTRPNYIIVTPAGPAPTNSWITAASGLWPAGGNWSLGVAPASAQALVQITNAVSKTVTIDASSTNTPGVLAVNNLLVAATGSTTNTLVLDNLGLAAPLTVAKNFTVKNNAVVQVNNSTLRVDATAGGTNQLDGSAVIAGGTLVASNAVSYVGYAGVGQLTISNSTAWLKNLTVGVATGSRGTITVNAGTLTVAATNNITGLGTLTLGSATAGNSLVISNAGIVADYLAYVGNGAAAHSNSVLVTGSGSVWSNALTVYVGNKGVGNWLNILNGASVVASNLYCGASGTNTQVTVAGGSGLRVQASGYVGFQAVARSNSVLVAGSGSTWTNTGSVYVGYAGAGHQLTVTNGATVVAGNFYSGVNGTNCQVTVVDGGTVQVNGSSYVGSGNTATGNQVLVSGAGAVWRTTATLTIGAVSDSANQVRILSNALVQAGNLTVKGTNSVTISGGSLVVTNSSSSAQLLVQGGTVTINTGTATLSKLSLTSAAGQLLFPRGTLHVKTSTVTNGQAFVVGDGGGAATLHLLGGINNFASGLRIRNSAALTGCGTISGPVQVDAGGTMVADCSGNLRCNDSVTNNGSLAAVAGTKLTFAAPVVNTGVIDGTAGKLAFLAGAVNSGLILPMPPPAPPASLVASALSSNQVKLSWVDNATNELAYALERSTNGTTYTQIVVLGANTTNYTNTGLTPLTTYSYRVRGTNSVGYSAYSNIASVGTPALAALGAPSMALAAAASPANPPPATSAPLPALTGTAVGADSAGSSQLSTDGSLVLTGRGCGFGPQDCFYYAQQQQRGDFTVVARVRDLTGDAAAPLAGVMIREGLPADARFAAVATTKSDHYRGAWFVRDGTATEEQPLDSAYVYPDAWVALVRAGDTLALYTSADGATWTWERSVAITGLAETVNVGVFVTSGATAVEATATVTDFSIVPLPKP